MSEKNLITPDSTVEGEVTPPGGVVGVQAGVRGKIIDMKRRKVGALRHFGGRFARVLGCVGLHLVGLLSAFGGSYFLAPILRVWARGGIVRREGRTLRRANQDHANAELRTRLVSREDRFNAELRTELVAYEVHGGSGTVHTL